DPDGWRNAVGSGFALGHDAARLAVVAGEAEPDAVADFARARPHTLLFAIERDDIAAALRADGAMIERAILHTLPARERLPDREGAIPLEESVELDVPRPLAEELGWARGRGRVWTAWVDGKPVSFAYAPWRSAKWFDVSVDTLPGARQLGLATVVSAA